MNDQSLITLGLSPDDLLITRGLWYGEVEIMASVIPLIDKGDVFEIVRDRIASILAFETASQQALATAAGKDPELWKFRVFSERINPWENLTKDDNSPVVNISYDNSNYNEGSSNRGTQQQGISRYNIDIFCYAESTATAEGHDSGDELSKKLAANTGKLIRNILMHDSYEYLLYRGTVAGRWIASMDSYQPTHSTGQPVERVSAFRVSLDVDHLETVPMQPPQILEIINVEMKYEPGGQIIAELIYDGN